MTGLGQDLHYALRQLRRSPGITLAATLILGLGIGVNTAIVAVSYQVLLRSLPVRRANELVLLKEYSRFETGRVDMWDGDEQMYFAYPAYQALRDGNTLLEGLAASTVAPATKDADKVMMQWVTGNYFNLLGVQPVLGRLLNPSDDVQHAGTAVAVLSESYWHAHFGGDSSILNQQLQINGSPFTIVGVVRHDGLMDSAPPAIFLPISVGQAVVPGRQDVTTDPLHRILNIIGRLPAAVSRQEAEAQLNTIWWNWRRDVLKARKENISDEKGWLQTHLSFADGARGLTVLEGTLGEPLKILEAMAFVVLLIACGNMANLLLAKAIGKRSELALHAALGGSRRRIFQKVICEGLLLGLMGAGLGLLLGPMTLKLLLGMLPSANALRDMLSVHLEWSALIFCACAGVTTAIVFSSVPAVLSTRIDLLGTLPRQRDSAFGGGARLRNLLVAAEIALSLFLLTGATVLSWRLHELRNTDPRYDASRHMLTFRVDASILGKSDAQVRNEYGSILDRLRQQPSVRSVAYASEGLIEGSETGDTITLGGYPYSEDQHPDQNWISQGFFSTMSIPLIAGREFSDQDTATSQKVAIVDHAFVKSYFGGDVQKALQGRFAFGGGTNVKPDRQIVGVVQTIHATSLAALPKVPFIYLPYDQTYSSTGAERRVHPASFYISVRSDAAPLAATIPALIHSIDRNLPVTRLKTMEQHLNEVTYETRMASALSVVMGGLALVLAAIGLYGVLAFVVTQRTREIGIRMALGADREHIAGLVGKQVVWILAAGLTAGAFLAWAGVHLLANRDANLAHTPLWLFGSAGALLLLVMLLAAALPARRAANVDPMVALRYE